MYIKIVSPWLITRAFVSISSTSQGIYPYSRTLYQENGIRVEAELAYQLKLTLDLTYGRNCNRYCSRSHDDSGHPEGVLR
jgi:hypothetical protein